MSDQKREVNEDGNGKNSTLSSEELTDAQALAMIQMGVKALAKRGRVIVFNNLKFDETYIRIANAKFVKSESGIVRLIDTEKVQ